MFLLQAAANSQIDWITVIASILGGGVASSLITYFASGRLKKADYTYDYRKYILEKRKSVYNEVEKILETLQTHNNVITDNGTAMSHSFVGSEAIDPINDFLTQVANVHSKGFWLSDKMFVELTELNHTLLEMHNYIGDKPTYKANLFAGIKYFDNLNHRARSITEIFFEDISNLDNIELFKRKQILYNN